MGMAEYEFAAEAVRVSDLVDYFGPRDVSLLELAQKALGLEYPPTYRRFLREFGAVAVGGTEFYGIIDSDFASSGIPDSVWATLSQREVASLPDHLVIVGETGMGEWYVLDTSKRDETGECPVAIWSSWYSENGGIEEVVAADFGTYFWESLQREFGPRY